MNVFRFALLLAVFAAFVSGYSVEGDCVVYENQYGKLSQCPHTLTGFLNYVEINATSYFNSTQNLDFAFGFDTSQAIPSEAQRWANASHDVPVFGNVSRSRQCNEANFSFTTEPKRAWCYWANESVKWEHAFVNGWVANKTVEWFEEGLIGFEEVFWPDWVRLQGFSVVGYGGKTWFMLSSVSFAPNETKRLRARIDVQPLSTGKYDVAIKRSSESWADAFDSGRMVLLDPWWNTSFSYCRNIQINETINTARSYEAIEFAVNSTGWANKPYNNSFRVVSAACNRDGTEQPADFVDATYSGNNYSTVTIVFIANATAGQNKTWGLYYDSADQGIPSYADQVTATNGSFVVVNARNINYSVKYSGGSVDWFGSLYGDAIDKCSALACLLRKEVGGWMFYTTDVDDECDITRDGAVSATVRCVAGENADIARYDTFYAGSYYIKSLQARGADYFVSNNLVGGLQNNTFKNLSGLLTTVAEDRTGYALSELFVGYFDTDENASLVLAKLLSPNQNISKFTTTGAVVFRTDFGTNIAANNYNLTTNLTLLFGFEPAAGADPVAADVERFYDKAQYPLVLTLGAEQEPSLFNLSCFDEQTLALLTFNASLTNGTNSTSYSDVTNILFQTTVLSGFLTVVVNATGYYPRTYYPVFEGSTSVTVNAYLLATSADVALVRFYIRNTQGTPVSNALVTVARQYGTTYSEVGQQRSDSVGGAIFYLENGAYYRVYVNATGYADHVSYITASGAEYTITLTSGAGYANFTTLWGGVRYFFLPTSPYLFATTLNFTLWATGSDLDFSGWFLHYGNGTILNWTNSTNSSGSTQTYSMVLAAGENLTAAGFFQRAGFGTAWINRTFYHANFTAQNSSLNNTFAYIAASTAGTTGLGIVALLLLTLLMAWVVRMGGPSGAGVVAVVALGLLTFLGFINWQLFALTAIAAFAIMYLNRGM